MEDIRKKLDSLADNMTETKVALAKLEVNYENNNKILDRLTASVEHHVKRTDALESLVIEVKSANEKSDVMLENSIISLDNKLISHIDKVKLTFTILTALGAIILGLKELGLLDKLF